MKVLIIAVNTGIGNVLMGEPLARKIKLNYPKSDITFLVSNNNCKAVLENNPSIDNIIILPKKNNYIERFLPLSGRNILRKLRNAKYDYSYVIFPHAIYADICVKLINAEERVSHEICFTDVFNKKLIKLNAQHDVLNNLNLIGGKNPKTPPKIFSKNKKNKNFKLIGIHPGCDKNGSFKRWSIENFVSLAKKLKRRKYRCIFFIGPDERELEKPISENNLNMFKSSDFKKVIKEISKCNYFISNDSGLMHIAEAVECRVIGIFGRTDYKRTGLISKNCVNLTPNKYLPWSHTIQQIKGNEKMKNAGENSTGKISVKDVLIALQKIKL